MDTSVFLLSTAIGPSGGGDVTTAPFIIISIGMKIEMKIKGRARLGGAGTGKKERETAERRGSRCPTIDSQ